MRTSFAVSVSVIFFCIGCKQSPEPKTENTGTESNAKPLTILIPEYRDSVRKEPVAQHQEKVDNPLNNWYFSVKLYETPKTFHYLVKLNYEEISGEDTLKLPNFGT